MKTNIICKSCVGLAALAALAILPTHSTGQESAAADESSAAPKPSIHASRVDAMNLRFLSELLKTKDMAENPALSPLAVATALEALRLGADGDTAKELAALLAYPENADSPPADAENSTWSWLVKQSGSADWSVNHGLWYHKQHPMLPSYLDMVTRQPSITLAALDFGEPGAAKHLADWAAKHSAGKLIQPVSPSRINDLTRMVWISLLNYQGEWQQSFDPAANTTSVFHAPDGEIKVTMMHGKIDLWFVQKPGYGSVALLPMAGNRTIIEIRLPERQMSRADLAEWLLVPSPETAALAPRTVAVSFPRTSLSSRISWLEILATLGAKDLLADANLSKATEEGGLRLTDLATETAVRFNEQGAEVVSSATAVVGARGAAPVEGPHLRLDRPFFWTIRETTTGLPVASGLLERPEAAADAPPVVPAPAKPDGATAITKPESPVR